MAAGDTSGRVPMRRIWLALVFGSIGLAVLCSLGAWQVSRLHWKEDLIASIKERIASTPITLDAAERHFEQTADIDYLPVALRGRFLHDREQHFLATFNGASGFFVYTPLELPVGKVLFVNRGFVPYALKDAAMRSEGQVEGDVQVTGLARNPLADKPSTFVPDNDIAANVYYWKDLQAMAKSAGLESGKLVPFFVDAGDAPNPGGYPVGGVTIIDLPNNHLQYAITWYGLAATLAGVLGAWLFRQYRSEPRQASGT